MSRPHLAALALAAALPAAASAAGAGVQPFLDLEGGALWPRYADVQVPNDTGTRFSLTDGEFATQTAPVLRFQAGARWGRHAFSATFGPLRVHGNGTGGASILFHGQSFTADESASFDYKLDTYRLTYRYSLVAHPRFELDLGATALVRDAEIRLSEPGHSAAEKDVGLVPQVSFRIAGNLGGPFWVAVDGDAGAAKGSRAEDLLFALEFRSGELAFRAGYRMLEGGVDSDSVYDFAWFHQVVAGVRYEL